MELEEFVREALRQIVVGVQGARESVAQAGGFLNPTSYEGRARPANHVSHGNLSAQIQTVEFDVAVAASDASTGGVGGGIKVMGAHLGGKGELSSERTVTSRVRFSVPVALPVTNPEAELKRAREAASDDPYRAFRS